VSKHLTWDDLYPHLDIVKESDDEYDAMAACPVHGGSDSLHVWQDDDDELAVHCFVCGASVKAVGESLGLLEEEEDDEPVVTVRRGKRDKPEGNVTAAQWPEYLEAKGLDAKRISKALPQLGDLLGDVRFPFVEGGARWRTSDGDFRWAGGLQAKDHPLWPDPVGEEEMPKRIYITEGETDMLVLRMLGYDAYSITTGANPKGSLTVSHYVGLRRRGVETVVLVFDADESGRHWHRAEAPNVLGAGLQVGSVDLAEHYDRWGTGIKDVGELWLECATEEAFHKEFLRLERLEPQSKPLDLDAIWDLADEPIDWLVQELVSPNEKGLIVGREKTYKTWIALNLARAVCTGGSFLNREDWSAEAGAPVLLVEEEGSKHKFAQRVKHVFAKHPDAPFHLWFRHGFRLTDDDQVTELINYIREHEIALVILDPLQRMMPGVEENSAAETAPVWDNVHRIAGECAVVVIHHANKQGMDWRQAVRGSSRTGGEVDFVMYVKPGEQQGELQLHVDGRDLVKHEDQQGYLAIEFPPAEPWKLNATTWQLDVSTGPGKKSAASQAKIEDALADGPLSTSAISIATGMPRNTVERNLERMLEAKLITAAEGPRKARLYALPDTEGVVPA
jgi:Zn ribbon nucleic-acid-binding protein